jgi:hypothetical protein
MEVTLMDIKKSLYTRLEELSTESIYPGRVLYKFTIINPATVN